ncbi:DNA polymerase-3 subunit epsilon [Dyadobacter jejuensis]|uniref:DNA polymerase-3 subunit epsilon n=1 Tax=Dyadobacter jejuensis TaxID=1082580 RepID=A0A316ARK5_9BACT|nr:exonuclease domain-containing protein [Dyadobacter jejuensis]PWJ59470.1 DNA polymerase-3 subunit epsilon [Dyadobacter jejuensis]
MQPGLNFTAIDFETATAARTSACSLGLVVVRNGQIVETKSWLIKPEPFEMNFFNERIHGISLAMLKDQQNFGTLWPEMEPYLTNQTLVAHNASFDIDVLHKITKQFRINFRTKDQFCTYTSCSWCWPELDRFKLDHVSRFLNIDLKHHDALSDAIASARIAIAMALKIEAKDIRTLKKAFPSKLPRVSNRPPGSGSKKTFWQATSAPADLSELQYSGAGLQQLQWKGKRFCVTGTFKQFPDRDHLVERLVSRGAIRQSYISPKTQIVLLGENAGPAKVRKIVEFQKSGIPILVFPESHCQDL